MWRALCAFYIYTKLFPLRNVRQRRKCMKYIRILPVIMIFLLLTAGVFAQTQESELLTTLDLTQPIRQMIWNAPDNELRILSGNGITKVNLSDPGDTSSCKFSDESYSFIKVSDSGVLAAMTEDWQRIDLYVSDCGEKPDRTIDPGFQILSFSIAKDGTSVLVNSAQEIRSVFYKIDTGEVVYDLSGFETAAPVYDSTLSGDGKYIVWHARGTFAVQNTADGSFGKTISLWDFASSYALSSDNKTLAVGIINDDYENGTVMFFDPEKGMETGLAILGKTAPSSLIFSADGSALWAADLNTVYKIDPQTFEVNVQWTAADANEADVRISQIALSPDGSSLAVLLSSGKLYLVSTSIMLS